MVSKNRMASMAALGSMNREEAARGLREKLKKQAEMSAQPSRPTPKALVSTPPACAPAPAPTLPEPSSPPPDPAAVHSELGAPYPIRLSRIDRCEFQPRTTFVDSSIESLARSIQTEGQQQPVLVIRSGTPGRFELIDGERRKRAFEKIRDWTGTDPIVLAYVTVVRDKKEHFRRSVIANLHREDLTPVDEAAAIAALRRQGDTLEGIARLLGKSVTYVDSYSRIDTLPDGVKALMDPSRPRDVRLTVTAAIDIARSTVDPDLRLELARETIERNLNLNDTRFLIAQKLKHHAGVGRGGAAQRVPRNAGDQYRFVSSFIGRTRSQLGRILADTDIDRMYMHVVRESENRAADSAVIAGIIARLEELTTRFRELGSLVEGEDRP
jgi:ParB/RepB/Spo0J family partition protein